MKVAIRTFGCSLNQADSEAIAGVLKTNGIEITTEEEAEAVIINSCTVKNKAEAKFLSSIKELEGKGKKVILAGCVPQADKLLVKNKLSNYSIIGTNQLSKSAEIVKSTFSGKITQSLSKENQDRLSIPSFRKNPFIEIIPISEGCLDSCSYCKTKHARGAQKSYRPREIVEKARKAVEEGVKELWLTSQDCGSYGLDIDISISD